MRNIASTTRTLLEASAAAHCRGGVGGGGFVAGRSASGVAHRSTARAEVFVRLAHLVVAHAVGFAQHLVDVGVQGVDPLGQRVAAGEDVGSVRGRLEVGLEVVAALATREDMLEAVKEGLVLLALRGRRLARVVERDGVQRHPQARPPHRREEPVGALEVCVGELVALGQASAGAWVHLG